LSNISYYYKDRKMGTNYYLIKNESKIYKRLLSIINSLNLPNHKVNELISQIESEIEEFIGNSNDKSIYEKIHLGKQSAGWEFLIDPNELKFYNDEDSFINFISQPNSHIISEYGDEISLADFLKLISRKNKHYNDKYCEKKGNLFFNKYSNFT